MELEQLEQLVAIREHGTISAAAEALHISQPALSRSVRRLEHDLGQELFERSRNHVRFNEAGELALEHADAILGEVRDMRGAFDELSRRQRTLKVVSVAPAPNWRFAALALERNPSTLLDPDIVDTRAAERALLNREASFAITLHPIQLPNVLSRPFMTEDLCLFAPASSDLASRTSVSFADIDGRPLIVFEQIGFWMDMVRRDTPHSEVIVQKDRNVFLQLVRSTGLLSFTTAVPENQQEAPYAERVSVPITDTDAHATFFLSIRADARPEPRAIFDWVCERSEGRDDGPAAAEGEPRGH